MKKNTFLYYIKQRRAVGRPAILAEIHLSVLEAESSLGF